MSSQEDYCELRDGISTLQLYRRIEYTNSPRFTYAPQTLSPPRVQVLARDRKPLSLALTEQFSSVIGGLTGSTLFLFGGTLLALIESQPSEKGLEVRGRST